MIETSSGLPRKSSAIFYNFGNFRLSSEIFNFWKLSESGRESSESRQKRSFVRYIYCSWHSNIKFISSRHRVISSIYFMPSTCVTHQTNLSKYKFSKDKYFCISLCLDGKLIHGLDCFLRLK